MSRSAIGRHPRVSIGMPVYNGAAFISEAIGSLLRQTFSDFELIICDNASTDNTAEICRAFAAQDARIRLYHNPTNIGAAGNYNRVFNLATGVYFKWASHDDMCAPEYLERTTSILDSQPEAAVCYPRTIIINEQGQTSELYEDGLDLRAEQPAIRLRDFFLVGAPRCHPVFGLIRRSVLQRTRLIGNYMASDRILLAELLLRGQFWETPEYLFFRRVHPGMSGRTHASPRTQAAWFDPKKRDKITLPRWRWLAEYLRAINTAPLSLKDRVACHVHVARWARWNVSSMFGDLVQAALESCSRNAETPTATNVCKQ